MRNNFFPDRQHVNFVVNKKRALVENLLGLIVKIISSSLLRTITTDKLQRLSHP